MIHHIFTSGGAAHDVKPSVASVLVSTASLDAVINATVNTNEDTTITDNPLVPPPLRGCEDPFPVRPFQSQDQAVRTVKQYAVSQDFVVCIFRTRSRGIKRVYLCC